MVKHESAGGVIVGPDSRVVVVSQNNDSWSLPKGRLEEGENVFTAALREIREETGIPPEALTLIGELGDYERHPIGKGGVGEKTDALVHITMFLFTTTEPNLSPIDPENPDARWVTPEDVAGQLTHPKDKAFFTTIALPALHSKTGLTSAPRA